MDDFVYRNGVLHAEDVPVSAIAEAVGTPCYVYSRATLLDHFRKLTDAFAELDPLLCFSIKSCANLSICRLLGEAGAGMDLVSGGELHRARLAGVDPARCVYAGVGKTDREIVDALDAGVGWFNVESEAELVNLRRLAAQRGVVASAALRVNPDVDGHTHRHTTTGIKATKFGVDLERAAHVFRAHAGDPAVRLTGIHLHIGSPVYRLEAYAASIDRALGLVDALARDGIMIDMLDLGGGYGADYESGQSPNAVSYADVIVPRLRARVRDGLRIILEPGRSIAANAGILLARVLYGKTSGRKTFVITDAGMSTLLRPSHYDAFHFIWPTDVAPDRVPPRRAADPGLPDLHEVDVVGPICETGDFLARDRKLPELERGDLLAVFAAGAYGMVMSSRYNGVPLPPEVLVDGASARLIRRRESLADLVEHELTPSAIDLGVPA